MLKSFSLLLVLFGISQSSLAGLADRVLNGQKLVDIFVAQGVSERAVKRAFEFVDQHENESFSASDGLDNWEVKIQNKRTMIIIDMTKPSSERRLYYLNLETGAVDKYYVAHGLRSGGNYATHFSNIPDSNQSSLGIYVTGNSYFGQYGLALNLIGVEASNDKAYERRVVMHGASYVNMNFLEENNRMGRSFGCPAVSHPVAEKLIPAIAGGTILSIHHDELMAAAQSNPTEQIASQPMDEVSLLESELHPVETLD